MASWSGVLSSTMPSGRSSRRPSAGTSCRITGTAPGEVQALPHGYGAAGQPAVIGDEGEKADQFFRAGSEHIVDRQHASRTEYTHRVWPPGRVLGPLGVQEKEV